MSKKSLPVAVTDEAVWKDEEDEEAAEGFAEGPATAMKSSRSRNGKPSRQRIEEYFERKRLAEVLQEDFRDEWFA
jgi:hypothetical protein